MRTTHPPTNSILLPNISQPNMDQSTTKEGRIALAIHAYKSGHFTSIRGAANTYDIPEATLRARLKGRSARRETRPTNCKLTDTEELTLVNWILSRDERGLPVRIAEVREMADLLLQKRSANDPQKTRQVGKLWLYNFVRRHDSLRSRYNRKYDYQRAKYEDPTIIRAWFRLIQNTIAKYGIYKDDIYNFNKTGFQIGVITTAKVITGSKRSVRPVTVQPGNREWVTAIECINLTGWTLPPRIIFEGKVYINQ
jgi:hypothetical protein